MVQHPKKRTERKRRSSAPSYFSSIGLFLFLQISQSSPHGAAFTAAAFNFLLSLCVVVVTTHKDRSRRLSVPCILYYYTITTCLRHPTIRPRNLSIRCCYHQPSFLLPPVFGRLLRRLPMTSIRGQRLATTTPY